MKKLFAFALGLAIVFTACDKGGDEVRFNLVDFPETITLTAGETLKFDVVSRGKYSLDLTAPEGWTLAEEAGKLALTAPAATASGAEFSGTVGITALDGKKEVASYSTDVFTVTVVTFEGVPSQYLAGPTSYGENLYSGYSGEVFSSYTDPATKLKLECPYDLGYGFSGFAAGGSAISQWNDMTTEGYTNQCSVYYKDATTGKGGNNGSKTFSIVYAASGMGPEYPTDIKFNDGAEKTIDHIYISNSTYAVLSMQSGDGFARALSYDTQDWFSVTIIGFDKNGEVVGTPVEYYLADFRTAGAPGIVLDWHKVDLSSLGKVNRLQFFMNGSNDPSNNLDPANNKGNNNLRTPAYFCMDDVAIRL